MTLFCFGVDCHERGVPTVCKVLCTYVAYIYYINEHRPVPLWGFRDSGAVYNFSGLFTYLLKRNCPIIVGGCSQCSTLLVTVTADPCCRYITV